MKIVIILWTRGMVKEVEELTKIVGKGNLLEALFIFLGNFQHANLTGKIDHRNHIGLSSFVRKKRGIIR